MLSFTAHDPAEDARYEHHPVEDLEPEPESEFTRLAEMLSAVLIWVTERRSRNINGLKGQHGNGGSRKFFSATKCDLRVLAFIYCVRGDLIGDGSLRSIAKHVGCSHEALRKHVDSFRRQFGFRTPGQWSDLAKASLSKAMIAMHQRQREE